MIQQIGIVSFVGRFAPAIAFAVILSASSAVSAISGPMGFVQHLGDTVITELTSNRISDSERVKRLRKLLRDSFDVPQVAKFVLGLYFSRATDSQFKEFTKLYEVYVAHNYAGLFKKYAGEKIVISREQALGNGHFQVFGSILQPSGPPVRMAMKVRNANGEFKALDLKIEGVSMPLTHRKQFASVIQRRGGRVEGLLAALRKAIKRFEATTPSE